MIVSSYFVLVHWQTMNYQRIRCLQIFEALFSVLKQLWTSFSTCVLGNNILVNNNVLIKMRIF